MKVDNWHSGDHDPLHELCDELFGDRVVPLPGTNWVNVDHRTTTIAGAVDILVYRRYSRQK